jgi:hypothetical protein
LKELNAIYWNSKFTGTQIEDYAKKLYEEGFIKTSKGYTTTANHLKGYLKKKNDGLLFGGVTPEFLKLFEKHFLGAKMNLSYSSVGIHMRNIRTILNQAISRKIISPELLYPFGKGEVRPTFIKEG